MQILFSFQMIFFLLLVLCKVTPTSRWNPDVKSNSVSNRKVRGGGVQLNKSSKSGFFSILNYTPLPSTLVFSFFHIILFFGLRSPIKDLSKKQAGPTQKKTSPESGKKVRMRTLEFFFASLKSETL